MFCITGCGFYASQNGYCSGCSPKTEETQIERCPSPFMLENKSTINSVDQATIDPKLIQMNKSKCWKCNKKVGLLGFECSCTYTFCKNCRYAEDHNCSYDYSTNGKNQIKQNNPLVNGTKLAERL
jgi:AN1-like Zinc finger